VNAQRVPPWTYELIVLLHAGCPIGQTAVDWAVAALEAGFDCKPLRILAGLDVGGQPTSYEASPLITASLDELGIHQPDFEASARLYVREVARATLAGELEPRRAADLVHRRVVGPLGHPHDLMAWCYVWEGNAADCSRSLEEDELNEEILSVAARFCE